MHRAEQPRDFLQTPKSMACQGEVGPGESHLRRSTPAMTSSRHFFKIILPSTLEDKRLRIPDKFVRKFGDELLEVAKVVVPTGHALEMGLTKAQNNVWFDDGWQEFVEHHSIGCGYLLVFRYGGFSNFSVLIFGHTSCEIIYPCTGPNSGQAEKYCSFHHGYEMEGDDSIEILCSGVSNPCCSLKNRVFDTSVTKGEPSKRHNSSEQNQGMNKHGRCVTSQDSPKFEHFHATTSQKCVEEQPLETADLGDIKESWTGSLIKHGISGPHGPLSNETKGKNISKSNLDGNVFLPKCEGHVEINDSGFANASQESKRAILAARMFKTKNPSFMVTLQSYNIYKSPQVYVPAEFAKKYPARVSQCNKLQAPNGREWPVRINRRKGLRLSMGWKEFSGENNLELGDVCVFELIKDKNAVLKVSIFRAGEDSRPSN